MFQENLKYGPAYGAYKLKKGFIRDSLYVCYLILAWYKASMIIKGKIRVF